MKITHIGSLPFLETQKALDYTFKFDIPVLFSLPKLEGQNMIDMANALVESEEHCIAYAAEFFKRLKIENFKSYKYQLAGPYTLWTLNKSKIKTSKNREEFYALVLKTYQEILTGFPKFAQMYFSLDEPMLVAPNDEEIKLLNGFIKGLKSSNRVIGIHSCNRVNGEVFKGLTCDYYSIDMSLGENLEHINDKIMGGYDFISATPKLGAHFMVTPACGLGLNTIEEAELILKKLRRL